MNPIATSIGVAVVLAIALEVELGEPVKARE
jgi:hypothetical protein